MNKPLLSICITTYNRSRCLQRCLESIKIQLADNDQLNEMVEVVVSDNCSPDNTAEVAKSYQQYFRNFKFVVNETNIEFDLNAVNAVTTASGIYCWSFADDDIIINGGIKLIVSQLKDLKYEVITVEAEHLLENNNNYKIKKNFKEEDLIKVDDYNEFFFKGYCQGGVSVLLFKRDLWLSCVNKNDFIEHWLYYETVLKVLAISHKMLYVKQPVIQTGQDIRWVKNGTELFTFVNSNILLEKAIVFGFSKERLIKDVMKNSKRIIIILLRAKGHGLKCNLANLKYIYHNLKRLNAFYFFLTTLIYFIPNSLIVIIRDVKKYIVKRIKL
jgi:glycosyltransferase involved in cell wall biosynthesis